MKKEKYNSYEELFKSYKELIDKISNEHDEPITLDILRALKEYIEKNYDIDDEN